MQGIGIAFSILSTISEIKQAKNQSKFDSAVAANNIQTAKNKAEIERRNIRKQANLDISSSVVKFAKGGVLPNVGTPVEVLGQIASEAEQAKQLVDFDMVNQIAAFKNQAIISKTRAKNKKTSALLSLGSTLATAGQEHFGGSPGGDPKVG